MVWITAEDAIAIHSKIVQIVGGIDGIRDRAGLEAAIAAPLQSFGGCDLFPTTLEKIARLGYGLASNHAFVDGNKRIGAMMTQLLLQWNGYHLTLKKDFSLYFFAFVLLFVGIEDNNVFFASISSFINSKKLFMILYLFN